jgi:hypothetical protein
VNRLLSLTTFAYLSVADCGGPNADFEFMAGFPLRSTSLDDLLNWTGAGTFEPSSPLIEPTPKRLRTLLARNQSVPSAGTLPAWSKSNGLVRLRGAIITSCISGARKELPQRRMALTFLVHTIRLLESHALALVVNSAATLDGT